MKLLVLSGNYLLIVLDLMAELLMHSFGKLIFEWTHMFLEESDILHCTIQAIYHGMTLFKHLCIS